MGLELKIVSPEKVEYEGQVDRVVVPGTVGQFEILVNHAPIISTLQKEHTSSTSRWVSWKYRRIK